MYIYIYNYLFLYIYIYNVILYRTCSYYPFVMHNSHTSSGPMLRGSTRFCGLGCLQFGDGRSRKHDKNDSVVVVVVVVVVVLVLVVVVVVVVFFPHVFPFDSDVNINYIQLLIAQICILS